MTFICKAFRLFSSYCFIIIFDFTILFQKYIQQLSRKRPKLPYPWRFNKKMWKTMCPGLENGYKTIRWRCCPIKKRKSKAEVSTFHFRSVRGENLWKPLVQRSVSKGSFLNYVGQLEENPVHRGGIYPFFVYFFCILQTETVWILILTIYI